MDLCPPLDARKVPSHRRLYHRLAAVPSTLLHCTSRRVPRIPTVTTQPILAAECMQPTSSSLQSLEDAEDNGPRALLLVRGASLSIHQRCWRDGDDNDDDNGSGGGVASLCSGRSVSCGTTAFWKQRVHVDVFRGSPRPQTASGMLLARPVSQTKVPVDAHADKLSPTGEGDVLLVVDRGCDARAALVDTATCAVVVRESLAFLDLPITTAGVTCASFLSENVFCLGLTNGVVQVMDTRMSLCSQSQVLQVFAPSLPPPVTRRRTRFSTVPCVVAARSMCPLVSSVSPAGSHHAVASSSDGTLALFDLRSVTDGKRPLQNGGRNAPSVVLRHRLSAPMGIAAAVSIASVRQVVGMERTYALVTNNGSTACFTVQDLQRAAHATHSASKQTAAAAEAAAEPIPLTAPQSTIVSREELDIIPIGSRLEPPAWEPYAPGLPLVGRDHEEDAGSNDKEQSGEEPRRRVMECIDVCFASVPTTRCMTQRIASASSVVAPSPHSMSSGGDAAAAAFPDVRVDVFQYGAFVRTEWMSLCLGVQERHVLSSKRSSEMQLHIPCGTHGGLGIYADGIASVWSSM